MIRKILTRNKTFFLTIPVFILFFGVVLIYGANRVYDREAKWRHNIAISQLTSARSTIESYISNLVHHMIFIRELPSVKSLALSHFKSETDKKKVVEIFKNLLNSTKGLLRISIIDSDGNERLGWPVTPEVQKKWVQMPFPFKDRPIDSDAITVAFTNGMAQLDGLPSLVVCFYGPLLDKPLSTGDVMVFYLPMEEIMSLLPDGIFIEFKPGKLAMLDGGNILTVKNSPYVFPTTEGNLELSKVETIHYSTLDICPGKIVVLGVIHRHIGLQTALRKLIIVSTLLLGAFCGFLTVLTYMDLVRVREKDQAQKALITSLIEMTDLRDPETGDHLFRTQNYAVEIARQLKKNKVYKRTITRKFLEDLHDAAPLHDIGKVGIKDKILLKAGRLDRDERLEMKKHVAIGKSVLQDLIDRFTTAPSFLLMARNIAAYHHEKWNGDGYPDGLKGVEIPIEARIFSIADVYDALRSRRVYKTEMSHSEALRIIRTERGVRFDPDVTDAFLQCQKRLLTICQKPVA